MIDNYCLKMIWTYKHYHAPSKNKADRSTLIIQGAINNQGAFFGHMSIDHRCTHIFMPQQFLYCSNIITSSK